MNDSIWRHRITRSALGVALAGAGLLTFAAPAAAVPRVPLTIDVATAVAAETTVSQRRGRRAVRAGRGHRGYRGGFRGGYRGRHLGFYSGFRGWGGWGWGGWGPGWGGWGWGPGWGGGWGGVAVIDPNSGAVDLDIRPEKARIYINGDYVGVADNYDGFPRYLWLRSGTYELVAYMDGFETLKRRLRVEPGAIIDMNDRMVPGTATTPEEIYGDRREERAEVRREPVARPAEPRREERVPGRIPRPRRGPTDTPAGIPSDSPSESRGELDRLRSQRGIEADQRGEPGKLALDVEPSDAVVYLDGRLLGSGRELSRLHSDLLVDPGTHKLEITRPGYATRVLEIVVESGERLEVDTQLDPE